MIKHNEEQLLEVNNAITKLKEYTDNLSKLRSSDREVFWSALKSVLKTSVTSNRERAVNICSEKSTEHPGATLANVKFLMGGVSALEGVLDAVEHTDDKIAEVNAKITQLKEKAKEIKDNIELQ